MEINKYNYKCPETRTVINRDQVLKHLSSDTFEWELDIDRSLIILNDTSTYNNERCVFLELTADFFNKDVYYQPNWSIDPADVQARVGVNIIDVGSDYAEEWDTSDIHEVFNNNINDIEIIIK